MRALVIALLLAWSCAIAGAAPSQDSYIELEPNLIMADSGVRSLHWPGEDGDGQPVKMKILKDSSQVFRFDREVIRAATSDPKICDITAAGRTDVLVNAKGTGTASIFVWDKDNKIATFTLESTLNLDKLYEMLKSIDPGAELKIYPMNKTFAVYGTASTSMKLKQIQDACRAFLLDNDLKTFTLRTDTTGASSQGGGATPATGVSTVSTDGALCFVKLRESKQILMEVRFAEVSRTGAKDFKLDLQGITRYMSFGGYTGETGATTGTLDESYTPRGGVIAAANTDTFDSDLPRALGTQTIGNFALPYISNGIRLTTYLKYLESKNILKIIARPNLLAKDGEEARFIVGGEYPVPYTSGTSGTSITYKEFGTSLTFTPEVLDGEMIRLRCESEVSELDFSTTVTSGGVTVPSLLKRQYRTTAELHDNETLVIGGILTQRISKVNRKVPHLGDVPLLGNLFKSNEYDRTDVELLVVITPHIIKPVRLEEKKEFYSASSVREAVRVYLPEYPDRAGDGMRRMILGSEEMRDLSGEQEDVKQFVRSVSKKTAAASEPPPAKPQPRAVQDQAGLSVTGFTSKTR